ncbi:MAG: PspC domain-containing protein [Bacteroidia bacterium]|nr:PspC domain-containing protein [Bacteroidia bacterium]
MATERYRRRSSISEDFDTSLMYDDIEKIREREEDEEKDQNSKLGSAGMMALIAGAGLLLVGVFQWAIPFDFMEALNAILPIIGFGALGYGFFKTMKLAFRDKELNFPALNVYRKTKPVPPPVNEEAARAQNVNSNTRYQRRPRTYERSNNQKKALRRSRTNRVFSGVAGGIAEYMGISAALIRFAFIAGLFMGIGMPIFIYLLLSIVLPANYDNIGQKPPVRNPNVPPVS